MLTLTKISQFIQLLWNVSIETVNSCEDNKSDGVRYIWIEFAKLIDFCKFIELIAHNIDQQIIFNAKYNLPFCTDDLDFYDKLSMSQYIHPVSFRFLPHYLELYTTILIVADQIPSGYNYFFNAHLIPPRVGNINTILDKLLEANNPHYGYIDNKNGWIEIHFATCHAYEVFCDLLHRHLLKTSQSVYSDFFSQIDPRVTNPSGCISYEESSTLSISNGQADLVIQIRFRINNKYEQLILDALQ